MLSHMSLFGLFTFFSYSVIFASAPIFPRQTGLESTLPATTPAATAFVTLPSASASPSNPSSSVPSSSNGGRTSGSSTRNSSAASSSTPPDVLLRVPELSVKHIELDVDNLNADLNLNANVAGLMSINAGVAVPIKKVNIMIADVEAELVLIVRLSHQVHIVNRILESLDLNPLLINTMNNVTSMINGVVGAVEGLLGSITQGGTMLNFLIDNLGNIVEEVAGVSTIVGNYLTNMTFTGAT